MMQMPRNILEDLSRYLADEVERATDEEKRAICVPVCKLAIKRTGVDHPLVDKALLLLEKGVVKDEQITTALEQLVGDLDDIYFAAEKRYISGQDKEQTYVALARRARAADAVLVAFNDDPFVAATWSTYEACAALGDVDEVQAVVTDVLHKKQ